MGKVYYENCGFLGLFGKQEATPYTMSQWCLNNKNIKKALVLILNISRTASV